VLRTDRVGLLHLSLLLFAVALVARAAQVQLVQRARWTALAAHEHFAAAPTAPPRGAILDETSTVLAQSRTVVRFSVAPAQVRDRAGLARALATAGVPPAWIARATDPHQRWVVIPGRYDAADAAAATRIGGVHSDVSLAREPLGSDGLRRLVGRVDAAGAGSDGLEMALDSVLRGDAGTRTYAQDARGVRFDSPAAGAAAPRDGNTVVLTVDHTLQEICDRALASAVTALHASGGDIVIVDPSDGSILAMASDRRDPRSTAATALTEPFEPGSTVKPVIAAALLSLGRARPGDVVDTHNGVWVVKGRRITDEHRFASMSLRDVIKYSSNIGISQFVQRLTPGEEYQALRDAGFGMPTGVPYPAESPGMLRPPGEWSADSRASLAFGYELSVTPLQLAMVYAAIANGGELLRPALVHEVRRPDGTVIYHQRRGVVRRLMEPAVADSVRAMLTGAVEGGTALAAGLSTFDLAGKTGTARRAAHGRYAADAYTASFVGLFPARATRYVIVVKLDDPQGEHFGGRTAAPITRTILQAAIAAGNAALDRTVLAAGDRRGARATDHPADPASGATGDQTAERAPAETLASAVASSPGTASAVDSTPAPVTVRLPLAPATADRAADPRPVPSIAGLPLRDAVRTLHRAGFRVVLTDASAAGVTEPAAGTSLRPGAIVRLAAAP